MLKNIALVLLGLIAAGAIVFGWYEHTLLERVRAANEREIAFLRKELDTRRATPEPAAPVAIDAATPPSQDPVAATQDASTANPQATVEASPRDEEMRRPPNLVAMLEDPNFARMWSLQQQSRLDARYADLFKSLHLSADQLARLKNLLVEKRTALSDVWSAARAQGLAGNENREELRRLAQQTEAEIDSNIRAVLGEEKFAQYQFYEQTGPQRGFVSQLQTRLGYTGAPLQENQSEALVRMLAEANTQRGGGIAVDDDVVRRAQSVLTPPQLEALRELQAEQQARQEMAKAFRGRRGGNDGGGDGPRGPNQR